MKTSPSGLLGRNSLVRDVQESIKQLIFESGLLPGDPMPTEFELMSELGVSRNSVREAMKVLEALGIVVIKRGTGMFVGEITLDGFVEQLEFHGRLSHLNGHDNLNNVLQIRELLEMGLLDQLLTSGSIDPQEIQLLEDLTTRMEAAAAHGEKSTSLDSEFHHALYVSLGNPIVTKLLNAFWTIFNSLADTLRPTTETPMDIALKHREILEAVKEGNRERAAAAMTDHFADIHHRLARVDLAVGEATNRKAEK
ncbi:FadR/GntR family transcriptional regulator [Arthrobacter psychrolactophilus]|nr:FadR/GntR family transcriptional regulator [Arthrobacter psychrolactophilus]